jgi:hypothetical protein
MPRLLLRLCLFVPFVLAMAVVNWAVDPAHFFGRRPTTALAGNEGLILQDLLSGRPHVAADDFSIPVVFKELISSQKSVDVLVLGSSVCTPFHSANFPGETMLNGAVPGGDLEEAMCMYELTREAGRRPKRILLEVHGWGTMLGKRRSVLIHDFHPIFKRVLKELGLNASESRRSGPPAASDQASGSVPSVIWEKSWFDPYDKLISPRYLQLALTTLVARYAFQHAPLDEKSLEAKSNILYPDGSTQWSPAMRSATPASIRQKYGTQAIKLADVEELQMDSARRRTFEAFIDWVTRSGTKVDLVFTPPLEWMYASAEAEYRAMGRETPTRNTERFLREFAARHHMRIFGAFDRRQTTLTDADYVDNLHIRRESIGKLLKKAE